MGVSFGAELPPGSASGAAAVTMMLLFMGWQV